ncbi:MAG: glycosyltransferase family 39 protein [Chloroflexota bacterium]
MKEYLLTKRAGLFQIAAVSIGMIAVFLISGWLGTYREPGFGRKEAILVIFGLTVAFIPLFRRQQLSHWSLEYNQLLIPLLLSAALMNGFLFSNNPNMGNDSMLYHSAFHNFVSGKGWQAYDGSWARVDPGYGMLSYLVFLIVRDIEFSGMIVSSLAYILMIPAVFSTVRFLFGGKTAILASFLTTFFPVLVSYSYINLSDCAFTFFALLSFSLFVRILLGNSTLLTHALLGLTLGMAYLIRAAEGLLVAGFVILYLFVQGMIRLKHAQKGERSAFDKVFKSQILQTTTGILFAIIALPYIIFIHAQTGVWTFSARLLPVGEVAQSPVDDEAITSTPQTDSTTPAVISDDSTNGSADFWGTYQPSVLNIINNIRYLAARLFKINLHAFTPLALLCAAVPFLPEKKLFMKKISALVKPDPRKARILLSLTIFSSPVLIHLALASIHADRWLMQYSIYILIMVALLTIRFLESMWETLAWKHVEIWVILLCLITVVASLGLNSPSLYETLTARHAHLGLRAAGLWLHEHAKDPANLNILAPRKGSVALFYASGKQFTMGSSLDTNTDMPPEEALEGIGSLLNHGGIDYMILDDVYTHTKGPLVPLWNDPDLAQIYRFSLLHRDSADRFQIYVGGLDR